MNRMFPDNGSAASRSADKEVDVSLIPFTPEHFQMMASAKANSPVPEIEERINDLRKVLGAFPEFGLGFFAKHLFVVRP